MSVAKPHRRAAFRIIVAMSATVVPNVAAQSTNPPVLVEISTTAGEITAEIYPVRAPITAENFLAYVDDGVFDGGSFFRSVRLDNQPDDSVLIEVIQGGPDRRTARDRMREPVPL